MSECTCMTCAYMCVHLYAFFLVPPAVHCRCEVRADEAALLVVKSVVPHLTLQH